MIKAVQHACCVTAGTQFYFMITAVAAALMSQLSGLCLLAADPIIVDKAKLLTVHWVGFMQIISCLDVC